MRCRSLNSDLFEAEWGSFLAYEEKKTKASVARTLLRLIHANWPAPLH